MNPKPTIDKMLQALNAIRKQEGNKNPPNKPDVKSK